jgi:signal peptidase
MKLALKWMNKAVSAVLIILLITVSALVITTKIQGGEPEVFGYQIKTVLSGSMEPDIQTGSIIAVKMLEDEEKNNMEVGDVITFMESQDKLITHRIIEVSESSEGAIYTTKGDNNDGPDREPVQASNVLASYEGFTIPYAGYVATFAVSPNGALAFLVLPGVLMVGYALITIFLAIRKLDDPKQKETTDPN